MVLSPKRPDTRLPRHPPAPRQRTAPRGRAGRLAAHPLRRAPLPGGPGGRAGTGTPRRHGRGTRVLRRHHRTLPDPGERGEPPLRAALRLRGFLHASYTDARSHGTRPGLRRCGRRNAHEPNTAKSRQTKTKPAPPPQIRRAWEVGCPRSSPGHPLVDFTACGAVSSHCWRCSRREDRRRRRRRWSRR